MPELNLEAAQKMAGSAIEHARQNNWRIAVAVLDAGGYPLQVSRMDGCNFLSPDIARGKAYAAAAWKLPSAELAGRWQQLATAAAGMVGISGSRIVPVQGALPIFDGSRCVGAIGASGVKSDEDEACSRAGLRASGFSEAPS
ncbi:MAG TPA: heme-binding protein [Chloroflexota bacterium]|nr:heme-binding protein [Chloroflexota bacterium]